MNRNQTPAGFNYYYYYYYQIMHSKIVVSIIYFDPVLKSAVQ